ncbi:MAG: M28 family peptidase [Chitinophagaceae bacterium]|nr:M28 family peptidase [Chitinophagaceae bacterium]
MKKYFLAACLITTAQLSAQDIKISKSLANAMNRVDTNTIRAHIAFLADDKLKGRYPGTAGYQTAVDYVIDQYKKMGLQPGGDNNGFTQKLVIRKSLVNNASSVAIIKDKNGNTDSLLFARDFTPVPHPLKENTAVQGQMVFAGYGVEIPGGYSDYKDLDVAGKIVVLINGAPPGLISTLTAHFSYAGNKINTAYAKGAIAVIVVNTNARPVTNPNPTIQSNTAMDPAKTTVYGHGFVGNVQAVINGNAALLKKLFLNSGKNMEQVMADLKNGKPAGFDLPVSISIAYKTSHTDFESYNVVAVLPGSDKILKNEYVVHSAHLDHVGIGKAVNGDSIYNGAHDNASGVASLLEIARIYSAGAAKQKRSVLIVMVTGEEMGLIGSAYFAANPTVPKGSIVADVNTDMPTVIAPLLSIVPLGAEHSTIMKHVKFAAGYLGLEIEKDPEPNENRFVRSDQYSFVKNRIPALHVKYGTRSNVPGFNLTAFVQQWRAKYYHQAADEINGIFNFAAAKTYIHLNFLISYSIAQHAGKPVWNENDLFGTVK